MPEDKKSEKNPYVSYSIEDVAKVEAGYYVIRVGSDLFSYNGKMAFDKKNADNYYQQVWDGLIDLIKNGGELEKEDAMHCLMHLQMFPLRIH